MLADDKARLDVLNQFTGELAATHFRKVEVRVKDVTVTLKGPVHYADRVTATEAAKRVPVVTRMIEDRT